MYGISLRKGRKNMSVIGNIKKMRHSFYTWLYGKYPLENKIIAWNSVFKGFGDSPKYIIEYLCENYPDKYDIVWVYDRAKAPPKGLPEGVRCVPYFSVEYLKEISTSKVIISNIRTGPAHHFKKRKGQYYIQTWHSSVRLKKIEGDAAEFLGQEYVKLAEEDSAKCDLIVSGCDFSTEIFANSFWYNGEILKSGTPRSDILFKDNSEIKQNVSNALGIKNANIVLYAPTFRDKDCDPLHNIDAAALLDSLKRKFNSDWVFVYRLHPNVAKSVSPPCENALSGTEYPDMQQLLCAADILITDYSSCMFDMCVRKKPCLLYAPDLKEYTSDERGLYFNIEDLPFPCALNNSELIRSVEELDMVDYKKKTEDFLARVGSYEDGQACMRVAERIEKAVFK